jgi:phosphinothricin acetyltransferase
VRPQEQDGRGVDASNIRPGEAADLAQINDIYNHYVRTAACTFDIEEISMERRRDWFAKYSTTGRHRLLVADEGGVIGYAISSPFMERRAYETSVSTSIYCAPDNTGKGVGSALYRVLFDAIAGEDIHRAYAGITQPNEASVALHTSFGFKQAAYFTEQGRKFDRYWDVAWFEKELP